MTPFVYEWMQPIYPMLIQQFLDDYQLSRGIAVDIGTGHGDLAYELAKATRMDLILVDINQAALMHAVKRLDGLGAQTRVSALCADVESLPLRNHLADFVMSRGSIGFWNNPGKGIAEIYRILKPGGTAVVGVGAGRYVPATMRKRIYAAIEDLSRLSPNRPHRYSEEAYRGFAAQAGLPAFRIQKEEGLGQGIWLEFRKPASGKEIEPVG